MDIAHAQSANCELAPSPALFFPTPQITTMTIARSTNMTHAAPLPMMRSTSGDANPMMRVTLPKELGDDPLASPIGNHPLPAFFHEPEVKKQQPEPEPEPTSHTTSSGFFTRRRQLSIEKKPPMAPSLRRTTSLPVKNASLFSKMAPMLKRVVSGAKSHAEFPEEDEDDDDYHNSRESLLMLIRVPEIQRVSLVPLMMASHSDY